MSLLLAFSALALLLPASALPKPGGMHRAQKHESRQQIDRMEDAWLNAAQTGNTAAMSALLADDYIAIMPNGDLLSKEQTLANLRSGTTHFTSIRVSDRRVRFYGTTALVTSRAQVRGTAAGQEFTGSYRYTRVYVRDKQGRWKIVSFEASRIRPPGQQK